MNTGSWVKLKKGYQHQQDEYVLIDPEDLSKTESDVSRNIEVIAFVEAEELEPVNLDRTYYLVPQPDAEKSYTLLHRGLREPRKVSIARLVMRSKEYIGAVNFRERVLMRHILFNKGEFKAIEGVSSNLEIEVSSKKLNLAEKSSKIFLRISPRRCSLTNTGNVFSK